jgi:hypothetical protein
MAVKISGMMGTGSMGHNNRKFITENVDPARTEQNITLRRENLKQVYHELFDEALAEYNAKKTKTRDKIPDYYRHIEKSKQTPEGERAAAALKEFAEAFQKRNPHLRVFNSVIHMDEATPHIHIDFVPVATEQKRGLAKRVSLKQALAQQGFTGQSKRQTEWNAWVNSEKLALEQIAQQHCFEVIHGDGGRPHMSLPEYKEAARELETARQEIEAARAEVSELQTEKETLQGTVKELKAAKKVSLDLDRIKPEETMMGNIKGITLKEVKQLKALAVRGAEAEQTVKQQANTIELQKAQITSLERQLRPSIQKRLKEAQELSDLKDENMALEYELNRQKDLTARLMQRVEAALNFLEEKLPEQFRPYVQRARAHIMPEPKQKHRHDRGMSMGGMER